MLHRDAHWCAIAVAQVIAELDEKKREALEITWNKVNGDFGSIFATLLPGTSAKLEPQEGHSFLDGARLEQLTRDERDTHML